ncbi:hypothetical protein Q763_11530, partial [Flavobacterium beibuense F44-8]
MIGLFLLAGEKANSQTTLSPGDILFTGFDATFSPSNGDVFTFVLLKDITSGTVISFTDRGYFGGSSWQSVSTISSESDITWTSGSALSLGTQIYIKGLTASVFDPSGGTYTPNGTVALTNGTSSNGLNLSAIGDEIIAYQGGGGSVTGSGVTIIAGINYYYCVGGSNSTAGWNSGSCADNPNSSEMPPGLTGGFDAYFTGPISGTDAPDAGYFSCTGGSLSTASQIRTAVMNSANWVLSATTVTLPNTCTFGGSPPVPTPVVTTDPEDVHTSVSGFALFECTATNSPTYQWQVDSGSGFTNISNGGVYSGATTSFLTLLLIPESMDGNLYRCVATNSGGSVTSASASLTLFKASFTSQTNVDCHGDSTGSLTVTVEGGTGPYTYQWDHGPYLSNSSSTSNTVTGLSAGEYHVIIEDSNYYIYGLTATITEPSALVASAVVNNNTVCGGSTGQATASSTGGTSGYSYLWDDSLAQTTATATGLSAGTYTVTIKDSKNCEDTATVTITAIDSTNPVADVATLPTITAQCEVTAGTITAPTATDNCEGTITGTTSDPLTYAAQGTYTITWTYDDGNGNTTTQTQSVVVDDTTAPVADVTTLPTITAQCEVTAGTITAPTATDNCEGTITGTTTDPLTYSAQGTYTITWTYNDGNGNTTTQTQTVIVDDTTAPVADVATLPTITAQCEVTAGT